MSGISSGLPLTSRRANLAQAGVILSVIPSSDPTYNVQIQRCSTLAASTAWRTLAILGQQSTTWNYQYTDRLPFDGVARKYRTRLVKEGYEGGAWSTTLSASPQPLPAQQLAQPPVWGKLKKSLHVPWSSLVPNSDQTVYIHSTDLDYIRPRTTASPGPTFTGPVTLAPGVTITGITARMFGISTTALARTLLYRVTTAATSLVTLETTSSGWVNKVSSAMTETVTTSNSYVLRVAMTADSTANSARFAWARIDYTMPSYDKSI